MLQIIQSKLSGVVAKIIIGLIVVSFSLAGINGLIVNYYTNASKTVATVNGEDITKNQLTQKIEQRKKALAEQIGSETVASLGDKWIRSIAINELINKQIIQQYLKNKLTPSTNDIIQLIQNTPYFHNEKGEFDPQLLNSYLSSNSLFGDDLINYVKDDVATGQLQNIINNSSFNVAKEIAYINKLNNQKRSYIYIDIPQDKIGQKLRVTKEQINKYFVANANKFYHPRQISLHYILINPQEIQKNIDVDLNEVKQIYQDEVSSIKKYKNKRHLAHILINSDHKLSDEQANTKLLQIKQKLTTGISFAQLAKKYSEDKDTAKNGGDLSTIVLGSLPPSIDAILPTMRKGEVSQPIKSKFGYHLVKLIEFYPAKYPSFASEAKKITAKIKNEQALEKIDELKEKLTDLTYANDNLQQIALKLGLSLHTSKFFTQEIPIEPFNNNKLMQAAFSAEVLQGKNSEVIAVEDKLIVLRLNKLKQTTPMNLTEAQPKIKKILKGEQIKKQTQITVKHIIGVLKQNNTTKLATIKRLLGKKYKWLNYGEVKLASRDARNEKIKKVFSLPKSTKDNITTLAAHDYTSVLMLTKIKEDILKPQITKLNLKPTPMLSVFMESLKENATIKQF